MECRDGGSVAKGVQGADVVPMEAIWRNARTEWLEWLECLGRQYTSSRPKAGQSSRQEADTQPGLLCIKMAFVVCTNAPMQRLPF